jgi:hypothetical protein
MALPWAGGQADAGLQDSTSHRLGQAVEVGHPSRAMGLSEPIQRRTLSVVRPCSELVGSPMVEGGDRRGCCTAPSRPCRRTASAAAGSPSAHGRPARHVAMPEEPTSLSPASWCLLSPAAPAAGWAPLRSWA